jgi:hypothetical protein
MANKAGKKRRPLFAPILAALLLVGCGSPRSSAPPNAPLLSKPELVRDENTSNYSLMMRVSNSKPAKLKASVKVKGDPSEVFERNRSLGFGIPSGASGWTMLSDVKQHRKKPIYIKIDWQAGSESGVERFVVKP